MIGLDKLIEYVDEHPRLIIGTLMAIILVGGLGGGLWIKSIKDNLDQQKELNESRLKLIEERQTTRIAKLHARYDDFAYDANRLEEKIERSNDSLMLLITVLQETAKRYVINSEREETLKEIDSLSGQILESQSRIRYLVHELNEIAEQALGNYRQKSLEAAPERNISFMTPFISLLLILLLLATLVRYLLRRFKTRN